MVRRVRVLESSWDASRSGSAQGPGESERSWASRTRLPLS